VSEVAAKEGGCGELDGDGVAWACRPDRFKAASGREVVGSLAKGASFRFFCEEAVAR